MFLKSNKIIVNITKNIKDNKIGIYKGEDFYCKESRLVL